MKTKMMHKTIHAHRTGDPAEVLRLLQEADKIALPEEAYKLAYDITKTVQANVRDRDEDATAGVYLLKIAYILNREGSLNLAPPKPEKQRGLDNACQVC